MEKKKEKAIEAFYNGNNCAQSVLKAYADELKFDEEQALALALGFGGGMGKMQKVCGAVTGAYMVIGLHNSKAIADYDERKEKTPEMVQAFRKQFCQRHQTDQCVHLLGCDIRTDAGRQYFNDHRLKDKVCSKCIESSLQILDELFKH
ncbi:C_GCAxxG_C_C family protein [Carboxylicivirga mesophila]|uniref:C_GCAxxG_C_C family protein n=1 Tax=Carboxylicivirga mesophila TaxID=1166478 RepID=A0ABS5K4F5_9BACT|nr:C-GCAxxG-C-C family protein [Carboxylicivirga mesophila]MBS2209852.1 C_GCAxxG_C_C family protein [Carboxylicivirga mesophila]